MAGRRTPRGAGGVRTLRFSSVAVNQISYGKKSHQNGPHGAPVGRCERSTARRATHPRTASQAGDALVGQTSGFVDHHEKERYDKLILMTC